MTVSAMLRLTRFLLLAAAVAGVVRAQTITVNTNTIDDWTVGNLWGINNNSASVQTFTGVLGVNSMTFRFFGDASFTNQGSAANLSLTAYFTEWNTATGRPSANTPLYTSSFTVSGNNFTSQTQDANGTNYNYFDHQLTLGTAGTGLVDSATYAMVLIASTGTSVTATGVSLLQVSNDPDDAFSYGAALSKRLNSTQVSGGGTMSFTNLYSSYSAGAIVGFAGDYGFSQISIITPVPETSTVVAIAGGVLVAGLVIVRTRQRRQAEAATAEPTVA
jgi:hypothetical protein